MAKNKDAAPVVEGLPATVPQKVLADLLGIGETWLKRLVSEGKITKEGKGKFPLRQAVADYVAYRESLIEKEASAPTREPTSNDLLRAAKQAEIARRMAREDREIITLDEAMAVFDEAVGIFLASISSMPGRITRIPREKQRLETIFDEERTRLADRFNEKRIALQTGDQAVETEEEDDA